MELKTHNGFELIKTDDLHKIQKLATFIPVVRNSVFKAAFNIKKLDDMLQEVCGDKNGQAKDSR